MKLNTKLSFNGGTMKRYLKQNSLLYETLTINKNSHTPLSEALRTLTRIKTQIFLYQRYYETLTRTENHSLTEETKQTMKRNEI